VTIPSGSAAGTYNAYVIVDNNSEVTQSNTSNDFGSAVPFTVQAATTPADLLPQNVTVTPSSVAAGGTITVSYTVRNQGGTNAPASHTKIQIKNSSNVQVTAPVFSTSAISAGSSVNESHAVTIPSGSAAGTYNAYVIVDNNSEVTQSNTSNDFGSAVPFTVQAGGAPDIRISPLSLTFDSAGQALGAKAHPLAGVLAAEAPAVTTSEVDVDLGEQARFQSSRNLVAQADGLHLADGAAEGAAESLPIGAPNAFSSLGVKWVTSAADGGAALAVRSSGNGVDWSDWMPVTVDEHLTDRASGLFFGNLIQFEEEARFIQYSLRMEKRSEAPSLVLQAVTFAFIDPGRTPAPLLEDLKSAPEPAVLSRTQWGCPDGQVSPLWSPAYTTVTHLIVHHTATTNSAVDWPAQVRSIWAYHTNTRGWGDIGYNYLIDPTGVIYEGRAGGDNVIGAHFSCQNSHTQGIALLGDYSSTAPTAQALHSLEALLAWIASREGVDPLAVSFHTGTQLSLHNISGHRDGNPSPYVCTDDTACPGDSLYGMLPGIRSAVASLLSGGTSGQAFTIYNDGNGTLSVTSMQLQTAGSWIQWSPQAPFDIAPGGSRQVTVNVDPGTAPAGSSTRRLLVSSNDPDESPYPGGVDIVVNGSAPACYSLSRSHTGSGSDPAASPTGSAGCPSGQYTAGASIQVTASPAAGWSVGSWSGTIDNGSTSTTNSVTMPAGGHAVRVDYVQTPPTCYSLSAAHTGSGSDPAASPASSAGCPSGRYTAGASIQVTASPAAGWSVGSWSGTVDDGSTSTINTVIMPASPQTVAVNYLAQPPACYSLSRTHTGSGSDPSAWPASSGGCPSNRYVAGSLIELTASPSPGWSVGGWNGTDDDGSTSTTDTVTMPAGDHTVAVQYVEPPEPGAGGDYYTVTPCRLLDTRDAGPLENGVTYEISVTGSCSVPATAAAIVVNVTAVTPAGQGHLTFWPAQNPMPATSTINFGFAQTRANNSILVLAPGFFGAAGALWVAPTVTAGGTVHLVLDVMGYFQ
jgi:hypothetical protein